MKRDLGFDAAKGFAIYSVVVLHIINFLGWRNDNILHYIVSYYMPIFFFISGYFGYKKDLDACLVIKKRFKELVIPYFTVGAAINLSWSFISGTSFYVRYMTEESKGGFWFLLVLFFFFLVYGLAKLVSNKNETLLFSILLSLYCIIFLLVTILPQNINYLFSLMSIRKFFPIFIVGLLVRKYENIISPWGYGMFIISFIIYMLMTYITYLLPEKSFSCMVLWSIGSVFGPIFYIDIFKRITILRSIFHFCGRYSLTIYIYHYIFMYILKLIVLHCGNLLLMNCSLFISAALITVACAYWGYLNRNYKYKIYFGL